MHVLNYDSNLLDMYNYKTVVRILFDQNRVMSRPKIPEKKGVRIVHQQVICCASQLRNLNNPKISSKDGSCRQDTNQYMGTKILVQT
jgi:hypothetical protein